jgi:hypothetical protein
VWYQFLVPRVHPYCITAPQLYNLSLNRGSGGFTPRDEFCDLFVPTRVGATILLHLQFSDWVALLCSAARADLSVYFLLDR